MDIREYQNWLRAWDEARGWDRVLPSHTLMHATEELGEVSKLVQMIEGYRACTDLEQARRELALELSDLQVMLFKLAYQCGVDMDDAMQQGQRKADARYPNPAAGLADREAYWQRFQGFLVEHDLA